jgi:hypothetical protein
MYLMRFEVVCVYSASSISKLLNPTGVPASSYSRARVGTSQHSERARLPNFVVDLVTNPTFHSVFAKFAIATELAIAILLVSRRFRYAGAFLAISFHAIIEVAHQRPDLQLPRHRRPPDLDHTQAARKNPDVRLRFHARDPMAETPRLLARFRFEQREQGGLRLQDRDGRVYEGAPALRRALMLCPLTFAFMAPLVLFDTLRSPAPEANSAGPAP